MTNEKWIMVFVSGVLSVLNLTVLRIAMLKISDAKATGAKIPWSLRMQVLLNAVSIGGLIAWWSLVLGLSADKFFAWALALLIATLFTVTADD